MSDEPFRLHIGGLEAKPGWKILNIQPGPHVDYLGDCRDLSQFSSESVDEVYASHVLEHLDYNRELIAVLSEIRRILKPGGSVYISVPDLDILCQLFVQPGLNVEEKFRLMRMMFGGVMDEHDAHRVGLTWTFMLNFLDLAGFSRADRVQNFGLFQDASTLTFRGVPISLNVQAYR